MDFVDSVLVRLADPATRAALFDADSMLNLIEAGFNTDAMNIQPPFDPIFDSLEIGLAVSQVSTVDGAWTPQVGGVQTDLRLRLTGLSNAPLIRVDALWSGSIVARMVPMDSRIESVAVDFPSLNVDPEIIADLGALPNGAVALENQRRTRVLARIRAGLDQPNAFTEAHLDAWLSEAHVSRVGELIDRYRNATAPGTMKVRFTEPSNAAPTPRALPFSGAIFVRGIGTSIADLLSQTKMARSQMRDLGIEPRPDPAAPRRNALVAIWMLPAQIFDDPDWPGAAGGMNAAQARAARRHRASQWLAREGIGLVTVA